MAENRTVAGHVANGTRIAHADSGSTLKGHPCIRAAVIGSALNGGSGHLGVSGDDVGNVAAQAANEGGNPAVL